ncbi:MAG: SGNH/GDSL hydrolase family protein [Planctomycetota bacterium]|nr:SGNH/GDSL hydrolase family protein [Planctomycetota bacterium]
MAKFPVKSGQLFLCIGDSITDCGRRNANAPYGDGYVSLFRDSVIARHPELNIRWLNRGIGGNTVVDLKNRWDDDVIREKPDWLSIKIGINDLHRTKDAQPTAVPPEMFRASYKDILDRTKAAGIKNIVLIDPFYLSTDKTGASNRTTVLKMLPDYVGIVHEMVKAYKTRHVATQEIFERQMKFRSPNDFAPEPVHPYRLGHLIIAGALYDAVAG